MLRHDWIRLLALPTLALSAVAAEPVAWSVHADVQIISLPLDKALTLLPDLRQRSTFDAAFDQLQQMLANEEASLLAWPVFWTTQNTATQPKSVEEYWFPVHFDLPLAQGGFGSVYKTAPFPDPSQIPTQCEARDLGSTVSIRPAVAADGKWISLQLTARFSRLLGLRRIDAGTSTAGVKGCIEQPEFLESKLTTQLLIRNGERLFAGSTIVSLPEPHAELFILHVTAEHVDF